MARRQFKIMLFVRGKLTRDAEATRDEEEIEQALIKMQRNIAERFNQRRSK